MADTPANEKLYAMVVSQAKAKYRVYPSPGASHWVHRRYLELGGKFVDSTEETRRQKIAEMMLNNRRREKAGHNDHDPRDKDIHAKDKKKKKSGDK